VGGALIPSGEHFGILRSCHNYLLNCQDGSGQFGGLIMQTLVGGTEVNAGVIGAEPRLGVNGPMFLPISDNSSITPKGRRKEQFSNAGLPAIGSHFPGQVFPSKVVIAAELFCGCRS
jgi:hypothetical protein